MSDCDCREHLARALELPLAQAMRLAHNQPGMPREIHGAERCTVTFIEGTGEYTGQWLVAMPGSSSQRRGRHVALTENTRLVLGPYIIDGIPDRVWQELKAACRELAETVLAMGPLGCESEERLGAQR